MRKVSEDFIKLSKRLNYNPISLAIAWVALMMGLLLQLFREEI